MDTQNPPSNYNASRDRHVKGRRERERREAYFNEEAFRYVMSDVRGRNFVWWVLSETKLYNDSFTGNSTTFYNEGKRSVGLKLIADLEQHCPKEFIEMWQEHLVKDKQEEREDEANRMDDGKEF